MRLNCAEGNGASLARRTSQDTARIARNDRNVPISRDFVRAILLDGFCQPTTSSAREFIDHLSMMWERRICRSFAPTRSIAVGAGGVFVT
jgi:hypothetical protein